jgi:hypothetical protein
VVKGLAIAQGDLAVAPVADEHLESRGGRHRLLERARLGRRADGLRQEGRRGEERGQATACKGAD